MHLIEQIGANAGKSAALLELQERMTRAAFLRSSWFGEWTDKASRECSIGFIATILALLFDRPRWKALRTLRRVLRAKEKFRSAANDQIIQSVIRANEGYFKSVEKHPLTSKQCEAVASDEDATLIIAGAGTGKTSTILAKIGLLTRTRQCSEDQILAISFTNKSANELAERVKGTLGIDVSVSTFHKLGLSILARAGGGKPTLAPFAADPVEKARFIDRIVVSLKDNAEYLKKLLDFCAYHRLEAKKIWGFNSLAEYNNWLRSNKIVSLDGVPKKSYQECLIANWLILNGVPFEYERDYEQPTRDIEYRQYCPDFYLTADRLYIEHFGVDEDGNTAPFIDPKKYREGMEWKRATHRKFGTKLIETFSWEHEKGVLLSNLEEKLRQRGCVISPISPEVALEMMNRTGALNQFSELVGTFLTLYKGNGNKLASSGKAHSLLGNQREKRFLELFEPVFDEYEKLNRDRNQIDFEDMITQASRAVIAGAYSSPYRYILIDEFQDISPGRAELVKAIRQNGRDCSLFAVGDDWQSIYRFTGSDIGGMTQFGDLFGATRQVTLDTTFRFDNQSVAVSSTFVIKNKAQIPKALGTLKKSDQPSLVLYKRATGEPPLDWPLGEIARQAPTGASVLILERYNFHLPQEGEWNRLRQVFPKLKLDKMSIHGSKGLEADYVVMGLRGGQWGFPSQVIDDPLLNMVLTQADDYPYGEERRLFYVAITRSRNKTFVVCETGQDLSDFAAEIMAGNGKEYWVEIHGVDTTKLACRKCKSGTMLLRDGANGQFYGCSNFPLCRHTEQTCPKCRKGLLVPEAGGNVVCHVCAYQARTCPKCRTGVMQLKSGSYGIFYGCSNFRDPDINCRHKENA